MADTDDRYRVALDLAKAINASQGMSAVTSTEDWLRLYVACWKAVAQQKLAVPGSLEPAQP